MYNKNERFLISIFLYYNKILTKIVKNKFDGESIDER